MCGCVHLPVCLSSSPSVPLSFRACGTCVSVSLGFGAGAVCRSSLSLRRCLAWCCWHPGWRYSRTRRYCRHHILMCSWTFRRSAVMPPPSMILTRFPALSPGGAAVRSVSLCARRLAAGRALDDLTAECLAGGARRHDAQQHAEQAVQEQLRRRLTALQLRLQRPCARPSRQSCHYA